MIEPVSAECELGLRHAAPSISGNGSAEAETKAQFIALPRSGSRLGAAGDPTHSLKSPNIGPHLLRVKNIFTEQKQRVMAGGAPSRVRASLLGRIRDNREKYRENTKRCPKCRPEFAFGEVFIGLTR